MYRLTFIVLVFICSLAQIVFAQEDSNSSSGEFYCFYKKSNEKWTIKMNEICDPKKHWTMHGDFRRALVCCIRK